MAISHTISDFLIDNDIDYHVYPHRYAEGAIETARASHVNAHQLAKAVVLVAERDRYRKYYLAVVPADHVIDFDELRGRTFEPVKLAKEYELTVLFPDCAVGAVPILGEAYGLHTFVDESLCERNSKIFFEAGDHEELICISADQFQRVMGEAEFAKFSRPDQLSNVQH